MPTQTFSSAFKKNDFRIPGQGIAVIYSQDLKPGIIGKLFHRGFKAVIVKDPRISQIWEGFMGKANSVTNFSRPHTMPWQDNLFNIALNHLPQSQDLGDMIRFTPGIIGHVARKMKIFPGSTQDVIEAIPRYFFQNGQRFSYQEHLLRLVWQLMSEIFVSTLPIHSSPPDYAVKIDLLKYPYPNELQKIFPLLSDSSGRWTQIGQKVDAYKGLARGIFNRKIFRDVFGISLLVPGMNRLLCRLNALLCKDSNDLSINGKLTIGAGHVDGSKLLTGLASDRDILTTQVFNGDYWVDLPLTSDSLAVFPSQKITQEFDFSPTWHRILLEKESPHNGTAKQNVTLSLSIVDR